MYYFLISSFFGVSALVVLYFGPACEEECLLQPILAMVFLGFFLVLFSIVIWGAIAATVPIENIGTAYGVAYAFKNGVSTLTPYLAGYFLKVLQKYCLFFYLKTFIFPC